MSGPATDDDRRLFLTVEECFALLAGAADGLVNFTRHALPAAIPVSCSVEGSELVLRSEAPVRLGRLLDAACVAVEADRVEGATGTTWRVVVIGTTVADRRGRPGVRVHPVEVTGHRLPSSQVA